MGQEYKIVLTGSVLDGFERQKVISAAAKLFKCSEARAERFLQGKTTPLKKQMDADTASRYKEHLTKLGIACEQQAINPEPVLELSLSDDEPLASNTGSSSSLELAANKLSETGAQKQNVISSLSLSDSPASSPLSMDSPASTNTTSSGFQCPKCGTAQPQGDECIKCGIIFSKYQAPTENHSNTSQTQPEAYTDEMTKWDEIAMFVGPDIENYRMKFRDIYQDEGKYKLQWHWPAFFIPIPWMFYRKMYVVLGLYLVLQLVAPLWTLVILSIALGLTGNYLYYKFVDFKLGKITSSGDERRSDIDYAGGTHGIPITIGASIVISLVTGFLYMQYFLPAEVENVFNRVEANTNEIEQAKSDPTKMKMLMLKNTLMINRDLFVLAGKEFVMPQNMDELRNVIKVREKDTRDKWGTQMEIEVSENTVIFYSAGKDKSFDTDDDIVFKTSVE